MRRRYIQRGKRQRPGRYIQGLPIEASKQAGRQAGRRLGPAITVPTSRLPDGTADNI